MSSISDEKENENENASTTADRLSSWLGRTGKKLSPLLRSWIVFGRKGKEDEGRGGGGGGDERVVLMRDPDAYEQDEEVSLVG